LSDTLLQASGISVRRNERVTLQPTDFSAGAGETIGVYGPNGAGKSTLLQALAGLLPLASGTITVAGQVLGDGLSTLAYHRRIAAVFQEPLLLRGTVLHNVGLGLALRGVDRAEREVRVRRALEQLRIAHLADRHVAQLSGGEAQRASLARALVLEPEVLFLDEPFAALDQPTRRRLVRELGELLEERRLATVFVTHDLAEASLLCDRCAVLDAGAILQDERPVEMFARPRTARVAEILGLQGDESSSVIAARVADQDLQSDLARLEFAGGTLEVPDVDSLIGEHVRVRVHARDVSIALARPSGLSIRNVLAGRIVALVERPGPSLNVQLDLGGTALTARITRRSASDLGLRPGLPVFALIKSISIDRRSVGYA
jgi:molybdenum ABC transporter ATP-binding protein